MNTFGVRVDNMNREEIQKRMLGFLTTSCFHRIATINPEFLLLADDDQSFRYNLNRADLNIADGFGLHLALLRAGKRLLGRYPGADLVQNICHEAERRGLSVFLAMRQDGLSRLEDVRAALRKRYPELIVYGREYDVGTAYLETGSILEGAHIVLCAFGAPEQEYFVESLRESPGAVRLALGVGGSLDYLTGKQWRAPRCLRVMGLEWLWRLITRPGRWRRIALAVVVFPWRLVRNNNKG